MARTLATLAVGFLALSNVLAHPGEDPQIEAAERRAFLKRNPKTVRSCDTHLSKRGHDDSAQLRRAAYKARARGLQGLPTVEKRDVAFNFSHASDSPVALGGDELDLFANDGTCLLAPDVEQGPFYVDGALIRSSIRETQAGVPLYLDIQIIDTTTCEPLPAVFVDVWHCNATGVYGGVLGSGNGDESDLSNLQNTFLRGIQSTDKNGVVQFSTIFPGHYGGRATHVHVLTHNSNETTARTNGTIIDASNNFTTYASHTGQTFFDQDLITKVNELDPYTGDTIAIVENAVDRVLLEEAANVDPIYDYTLLGDDLSDGILAWIRIGIDPSVDSATSAASTYHPDGGAVQDTDNTMQGGGGGVGGNTTGGTNSTGA